VIDYSCADEVVAKLLLRYADAGRPGEVYFLVRGLQEYQADAVEAVLERHNLLVTAEVAERGLQLLGPSDAFQRNCWSALPPRDPVAPGLLAAELQLPVTVVRATLESLIAKRVAVRLEGDRVCGVPALLQGGGGSER
jgi:hypothetical protein